MTKSQRSNAEINKLIKYAKKIILIKLLDKVK